MSKAEASKVNVSIRGSNALANPPKLVLHFDVNGTIMMEDKAAGVGFEDTVCKSIAKSMFVSLDGKRWSDGTMIASGKAPPPVTNDLWSPPEGCVSYYDRFRDDFATKEHPERPGWKTFVEAEGDGAALKRLSEKIVARMCNLDGFMSVRGQQQQSQSSTPDERVVDEGMLGTQDPRMVTNGRHLLVPSFFKLLEALLAAKHEFVVVIRTFGVDADDVLVALEAFSERHAAANQKAVPSDKQGGSDTSFGEGNTDVRLHVGGMYKGRYITNREEAAASNGCDSTDTRTAHESKGEYVLERTDGSLLRGQDAISNILLRGIESSGERGRLHDEESRSGPCGRAIVVTDDYGWWKTHEYAPQAGKPLFIDETDSDTLPIFFDDNIHQDANDSIVAPFVRIRNTAKTGTKRNAKGSTRDGDAAAFQPCPGEEWFALYGKNLFKANIVSAAIDDNYYIKLVESALSAHSCANRIARR